LGSKVFFERRTVGMTDEQRKVYRRIVREWAYEADGLFPGISERDRNIVGGTDRNRAKAGDGDGYDAGGVVETDLAPVQFLWLRRVAGGFTPDARLIGQGKVREVLELLRGELSGKQLVVWFAFRDELELVRVELRRVGISSVCIHGGETFGNRKKALESFQSGRSRVLLATEDCAKYGVDASAADCAIYYSNSLSNDARQQSIKRIVHPMKKRPLLIVDLVSNETIDEDIVDTMVDKGARSGAFMVGVKAGEILRACARGLERWK
jgi:SNF2 family DNA or RNA helicase